MLIFVNFIPEVPVVPDDTSNLAVGAAIPIPIFPVPVNPRLFPAKFTFLALERDPFLS
ncbi:hypothetical protein VUJ46_15650 [Chryseobacterium sp. MYb264]|uniref:hypothetical protein n=1 Tax=Chryseobacterium sp. MYb264 TaxID=2745153 RepID=UPI002E106722|nr:hypothetical protein VUJ46_15650 [Chryseobacterium sp. MYb264]